MIRHSTWVALMLAGFGSLALSRALAAPAPVKPAEPVIAERPRKELEQLVTVELVDNNLDQAVATLREQTKLNLVLDRTTLALNGLDPGQLVVTGLKFKETKARQVLRSVLLPHNLTFVLLGDTVLVTTEEMAYYRQLKQRVSVRRAGEPIRSVVAELARDTGVNIVVDPRLTKEAASVPVALTLEDVPLESAVRLLSECAGLKVARFGNVLMVTNKAIAAEMRSEPELVPTPRTPLNVGDGVQTVPAGVGGGLGGVMPAPPPTPVPPGGG